MAKPDYKTRMEVQLGDKEFSIVPQRIGYLQRALPDVVTKVFGTDEESAPDIDTMGDLVGLAGGMMYDVLAVFIPGFEDEMPRWMWDGYGSEAAASEEQYERAADLSPDPTQIEEALRIAAKLNKLDLLGAVKNLIGPDLIRAYLRRWVADQITSAPQPT